MCGASQGLPRVMGTLVDTGRRYHRRQACRLEGVHDYHTSRTLTNRHRGRAPSVAGPSGTTRVARRVAALFDLLKSQHHHSRDIRCGVHGRPGISPFSATPNHQGAFHAALQLHQAHRVVVASGHLGHHFGVASPQRAGVGDRRRTAASRDAVPVGDRTSSTPRTIAVAQARCLCSCCVRGSSHLSTSKTAAALSHSIACFSRTEGSALHDA